MNKLIVLSLISAILVACDGAAKPSKQTVSVVDSSNLTIKTNDPQNLSQTTITITKSMLDKPTKLKMSELIDDISFIRLETNKESVVESTAGTAYTKDFIYFYKNRIFTWDGKWKVNIGIKGRGPYEELMMRDFNELITFKDGKFYSKGSKLIEYDINGRPTKKVRTALGESGDKSITLNHAGKLAVADKYLFSSAPDAVYFISPENLETVKRIELIPNKIICGRALSLSSGNISYYRDNLIYSNPFIDTVFYVKDKALKPMCKLHFEKDLRMSINFFHQITEIMTDFGQTGNKMREMKRNRGLVDGVWETNKYIFLQFNRFDKEGQTMSTLYIVYDKNLKTSKAVRAEDLVNDIIGQGDSRLQIIDEKIVMEFWPHEIFDIIDKKKKAGEKIHPKLAALAEQIDEGDNPVIFVAHLKK